MNPVGAVIFDLDGTLIQTETLVLEVAKQVVESHGKELTHDAIVASLGRSPLDAWATVADMLELSASPASLFEQSEPLLTQRWHEAALLPGARRLVSHLRAAGVRLALATSTPRETLHRKLSSKPDLRDAFELVRCGDDVDPTRGQYEPCPGKPAPDCFLHTAAALGVTPSDCLVIEDAPCGVQAATAAGMRVIVVPSLPDNTAYPPPEPHADSGVVEILPSLLAFHPERYGLPPFSDFIANTVPLDPVWRINGTVVRGFGRGSKELGIPTANLDAASVHVALAEAVTGIYGGWASLGVDSSENKVYPMVMSVGWNPVFKNKEKTCEPWILHDFKGKSFYGECIRLVVVTFIRPEANFESVDALVARIHKDAEVTLEALKHPQLEQYMHDGFLR